LSRGRTSNSLSPRKLVVKSRSAEGKGPRGQVRFAVHRTPATCKTKGKGPKGGGPEEKWKKASGQFATSST